MLPAWDFSLHHFLFVLQEKGIGGSVLDSLSQALALVSHGPILIALV